MKENFIGVYEGKLPEKLCTDLINTFDKYQEIGLTRSRGLSGQRKKVADDDQLFVADIPLENLKTDMYNAVYEHLGNCFKDYLDEYEVALGEGCDQLSLYELKLQKTNKGQGYHAWHFESSSKGTSDRVLAYTIYLNDIDDGGETEFLYQSQRIKPTRGTVIIFPAAFTHTHRGNPPLSGSKYIVTGWFNF